jgi:hypothetical protein
MGPGAGRALAWRAASSVLAGGNTHAFAAPGTNVVAVLLQYGV